ncbi:MAG: hypothetical protein IT249_04525 [Chitinophagaceae bacterium]|nr:hypothetical protein [Chitinophagaceae bacterium]
MVKKLKKYYQSAGKLNALFFLTGILLGLLIFFYSENSYEDKIFEALATDVIKLSAHVDENDADTTIIANSLRIVHSSLQSRQGLFYDIGGIKAGIIRPITVDLMTADGECGSYAIVLARLLKELNYNVRMVLMKVDGKFGGHILLEAKNKNGWVALDPSYNLYFKRPDGKLASFDDIQTNWDFYKMQVPLNYNMKYRYEDKQYTNWNKIPVFMPAAKKVLDWAMGKEKADDISLRAIMLRKSYLFFTVTLIIFLSVLSYMVYYIYRKQKHKAIAVPSNDEMAVSSTKKPTIIAFNINSKNTTESLLKAED